MMAMSFCVAALCFTVRVVVNNLRKTKLLRGRLESRRFGLHEDEPGQAFDKSGF